MNMVVCATYLEKVLLLALPRDIFPTPENFSELKRLGVIVYQMLSGLLLSTELSPCNESDESYIADLRPLNAFVSVKSIVGNL